MKFSAGHFTIFSDNERERLHGHNFTVYCAMTAEVGAHGLVADYRQDKVRLLALCAELNEIFLLPGKSPFLRIEAGGGQLTAHFAGEAIPFLERDVKILPVRNVTLEELSSYLLGELVGDGQSMRERRVREVMVKVGSGPGQFASSRWCGAANVDAATRDSDATQRQG